jgi:glycosyltransferase involved in cell wall biosynthesis
MRVLFLNYEYPPLGGGAGNATSYLLKEFAKIPDLKVDLVTSSIDEKYHWEKVAENIQIHRLPIGKNQQNLHFQSQKDLIIYFWKAYGFSKKMVRENKYNLTLAFFSVPCGFLAWIFKKQFKLPYVISLRGADVPGYSERFAWLYKLITPLIKKIWKDSAYVIANSQGLKDLALKTNPQQKIEIIPNGINTNQFIKLESYKVIKSEDQFKILCVTRITPRKNIRYLIEAFSQLYKKYAHLNLQIIGEGDEKANLEKLVKNLGIEKQVKFIGLVPHEKLPAYYQSAGAYVLPSQNEGMSNSMLEALSSGLPLLATDTGGTQELIEDGVNGFILQMKSAEDIAEKLEILIKDEELRKKMGRASREKAERMSWEKVAQEYIEICCKIKKEQIF